MKQKTKEIRDKPDITINAAEAFDIDFDMEIPAYSEPDEYVPKIDKNYFFLFRINPFKVGDNCGTFSGNMGL